jgi:hypothetical protein
VSPAKPDQRGTLQRSTSLDRVQHDEPIAMNTSTDIQRPWLVGTIMAATIAAIAASVTLTMLTQMKDDPRLIHLGAREVLARTIPPPYCDSRHHFCISHNASGNLVALYTYDPHIRERQPCEVVWHPDREREGADGSIVHGLFDDPCGGSVYDITGHRLFGPTPRDLDAFPFVPTTDNSIIVDTHTLICGRHADKETLDCERAPGDN